MLDVHAAGNREGLAFPSAGTRDASRIGRLGNALLDVADRIDRSLYGRRATVIVSGAVLTVVCPIIEAEIHPDTPLFTAMLTWAFVSLLFALGLARLGSLRDDGGQWSLELARRRAHELLVDVRDSFAAFRALESPLRWKMAGRCLICLGFMLLALRTVGLLFTITLEELFGSHVAPVQSADHFLLQSGASAVLVGFASWLLGYWKLKKEPSARQLRPSEYEQSRILEAACALPSVIDCADSARVRDIARRAGHPVLEQLLHLLADWKPRRRDYEDEYQASLHRLIRRRMPNSNPQRERPIGQREEGTAGRADIVVSESVLIEMKRGFSASMAQRALGQIHMYLRAWNHGPVILLLCDADSEAAKRFLGKEIDALRARAPVFLVLAARAQRSG